MEKLIKSRNRVKKHAEVFTPKFIVGKMNDLCEPDISDIRKTVLEPACGEGAFLTNILGRRLKKCNTDHDRLVAISNLYGVDIQKDNVEICRKNLLDLLRSDSNDEDLLEAAEYIVANNVVVGDTINEPEKIIFLKYHEVEDDDEAFLVSCHCLADIAKDP